MNELPPLPRGMNATFDHDGARWTVGGNTLAAVFSVMAILATAWLFLLFGGYGLVPAFVIWLVAGLVLVQSVRRTVVRVNPREIALERRSLLGTERQIVRVDDITHQGVATSDRGDAALVLRTRDETVVIGSGCNPIHLAWLAQVVLQARALTGQREKEEGREWSFLRKAPEAIDTLRK